MITFRNFTNNLGYGDFGDSFMEIAEFLANLHKDKPIPLAFPWGRWEWMFSLPYLDKRFLDKIGIWKHDDIIVSLVTYESGFGEAYYIVDPRYGDLKPEMAKYAISNFTHEGKFRLLIPDNDQQMKKIAFELGLRATNENEHTACFDARFPTEYQLPEGFQIKSLADDYDVIKYHKVLWKGFDHGSEVPINEAELSDRRISLSGPHFDPHTNIAVVAPSGEFVSYCGTWYMKNTCVAYVEPVATDPDYRKLGLGKAAVLEAIKRCFASGAKYAFVGSNQNFYYRLGFYPLMTYSWWK